MKRTKLVVWTTACLGSMFLTITAIKANAYEVDTHAWMTQRAVQKSRLSDLNSYLHQRLGLLELHNLRGTDPFGSRFYDFIDGDAAERFAGHPGFPPPAYESLIFNSIASGEFLTIRGWMIRGAIREDDVYYRPTAERNNPQDDLCTQHTQPCWRVLNHFFDPYNNRQLSILPPLIGEWRMPVAKSPDWAYGATDAFATAPSLNPSKFNQFSIFDAREAMYRAMTLRRKVLGTTAYVDIFAGQGGTDAERAAAQSSYWATTFRALGSVVHHIQDMAQPQHTRSDAHAGEDYESGGIIGHKSFFENYVNARALRRTFVPLKEGIEQNTRPLPETAYPVPQFNTYADFWSTARGSGVRPDSLNGKGLADYTSRGFYSIGTNVGSNAGAFYPQPGQSPSPGSWLKIDGPLDMNNQPLPGSIDFLVGSVTDTAYPSETQANVLLSSRGLFNQFLQAANGQSAPSLNVRNYDDQVALLVPRTVAYSAGFIDYFFRGQLKISLPPEKIFSAADFSTIYDPPNAGFKRFKVVVQNVTPAVQPPGETSQAQSTSDGHLVAVLRYRLNSCLVDASGNIKETLDGSPKHDPSNPSVPIWDESCRTPAIRPGINPTVQVLPKIVVSNMVEIQGGLDSPQTVIFDFPKPLPFNAVDVDIQVVYRGTLGTEPDGIAVGFEYLSEPNFFNLENMGDCAPACTTDCNKTFAVQLPFAVGGIREDAKVINMPPGRYARVAFLTYAGKRRQISQTEYERVVNNQDYAYSVPIMEGTTQIDTWQPGVKITEKLFQSRELQGRGRMLSWRSVHQTGSMCNTAECFDQYNTTCGAMNPTAFPVTVLFANP